MNKVVVTSLDELENLFRSIIRQELGNSQSQPPTESKYLTLSEAAHFLKLPESTLYRFTSQRLIPFTKSGRKLLFAHLDLERWLVSRRRPTRQEIANQLMSTKGGKQ
jgi:excisionase family DNA binding protein